MVQVVVECQPGQPPSVLTAPENVTIRLGRISYTEVNDLRHLLRQLTVSAPRRIEIDLSGLDRTHKPAVFAVVVGAAREARRHGSTILVARPPTDQRRAFAAAHVGESGPATESSYVLALGQQSSAPGRKPASVAILPAL